MDKKEYDAIINQKKMKLYASNGLASASVIGLIFSSIFFLPALPICFVSLIGGIQSINNFKNLESKYENESQIWIKSLMRLRLLMNWLLKKIMNLIINF